MVLLETSPTGWDQVNLVLRIRFKKPLIRGLITPINTTIQKVTALDTCYLNKICLRGIRRLTYFNGGDTIVKTTLLTTKVDVAAMTAYRKTCVDSSLQWFSF